MGLDINTLKNAKLVQETGKDNPPDWDRFEEEWSETQWIHNRDHPKRLNGHHEGFYRGEKGHDFRAGSYGGYNEWRAALCRWALNVEPEVVWANPERFEDKSFVELINMSDCEGAIGPDTCMKLHGDFEAWRANAMDDLAPADDYTGYYVKKYEDWATAFAEAAGNGFVIFH